MIEIVVTAIATFVIVLLSVLFGYALGITRYRNE